MCLRRRPPDVSRTRFLRSPNNLVVLNSCPLFKLQPAPVGNCGAAANDIRPTRQGPCHATVRSGRAGLSLSRSYSLTAPFIEHLRFNTRLTQEPARPIIPERVSEAAAARWAAPRPQSCPAKVSNSKQTRMLQFSLLVARAFKNLSPTKNRHFQTGKSPQPLNASGRGKSRMTSGTWTSYVLVECIIAFGRIA